MKFGDDVLLAIMACFRKGLIESCDISDLLRGMDLKAGDDGKVHLGENQDDIWKTRE